MSTKLSTLAIACVLVISMAIPAYCAPAPKKVLVVTTTKGFRHSSIPTAEKVIAELAADSKAFTVDYARVEPADPQFKGPDGKPDKQKVNAAIEKVLAEKMSPEALKTYDGVIFANTTGDLPIPNKEAFLEWIKSGKAFVGMHAATDTFPNFPAYIEMIGGQFQWHGAQVEVDTINGEQECPMCRHLGDTWKVFDEIYLFKNFDPNRVHMLLSLDKHPNDKTPGQFPISWCRNYGKGRVFYTALGHREDVWDANTPPNFERKNPAEVAKAYQAHILGGIKWTLGLEKWTIPPRKDRVE
jgi:uncharacterized protein